MHDLDFRYISCYMGVNKVMGVELNGVEGFPTKNRDPHICDTKCFLQSCNVDIPCVCQETRTFEVYTTG